MQIELSLSQIAYLCAIPNSPSYYNPYRHPDHALTRRDKILGDMLTMGYITQEEHDAAVAEEITVTGNSYEMRNYETTYAIDCAVRWLMEREGFSLSMDFPATTITSLTRQPTRKATLRLRMSCIRAATGFILPWIRPSRKSCRARWIRCSPLTRRRRTTAFTRCRARRWLSITIPAWWRPLWEAEARRPAPIP